MVDVGHCRYFGIPMWLISVDLSDVIKNAMLVLGGLGFFMIGVDAFKKKQVSSGWLVGDLASLFGFLPGIAFFSMALAGLYNPLGLALLCSWISLIAISSALLLRKYSNAQDRIDHVKNKMEAVSEFYGIVVDVFSSPQSLRDYFRVVVCILAAVLGSGYIKGWVSASELHDFEILLNPLRVVISEYDGKLVTMPCDTARCTIDQIVIVEELSGDKPAVMRHYRFSRKPVIR